MLIDYLSKWIELVQLKSKNSFEIVSVLKKIFSIHGIPVIMISDNMPFNSLQFKNFSIDYSFKIITSSPYYPKSNGLAEKAVGICKNMLKKSNESKIDIDIIL